MNKLKEEILNMTDDEYDSFITDLAKRQFFVLTPAEKTAFRTEFTNKIGAFEIFNHLNLKDIEPLNYPIETNLFHLRSDEIVEEIDADEWLKTEKHNQERYVEINYEK